MTFEVAQSWKGPDEWVVETVNHAGDGEVYAAQFSGPLAKERAEEYAAWKNSLPDGLQTRSLIPSPA